MLPVIKGHLRIAVYYEDTDFTGYVYHANYLKFFERAREELIGLSYVKDLYKMGYHFVVGRMNLSYHKPARHGDIVEIYTEFEVSDAPITNVMQVASLVNPDQPHAASKLVTAHIKLVGVNNAGESTRPPPDVVSHFANLASTSRVTAS